MLLIAAWAESRLRWSKRLADNTIVVFTSDNGGAGYVGLADVNAPYRGWKITYFEAVSACPCS